MMLVEGMLVAVAAFVALLVCLASFAQKFGQAWVLLYGAAPLAVFTAGFCLRIAKSRSPADIGFYLTDISFLSANIIFTMCLMLGQIRYWKINRR